jgi:hypothetical protein
MHQSVKREWREIGWGALASVALHLSVAFLLLVRLHAEPPKPPEEQSVKVELVSPPPPKPEEKPRQGPAKAEPEPPRPQAFESAAAQAEQKVTEPQLPPAGQVETQDVLPTPENSSPAQSKPESATREAPPQTKPALLDPVLPEVGAATEPSETEPRNTATASVPVHEQMTSPGEATPHQAAKPPEIKIKQRTNELDRARDLFSPKSLFDPRVMQAIGKLPRKARIRQLCNIEALEQIRRQKPGSYPDILVPYGSSGGIIMNDTLSAKGGAFRSGSNWYNVDFKCQVDADTTKVVSFRFAIGGAVPKSEWKARQLPVN